MAEHTICPWWVGYILASPIRKLVQDPARMLKPFVRIGMTALEPGPGMGFSPSNLRDWSDLKVALSPLRCNRK